MPSANNPNLTSDKVSGFYTLRYLNWTGDYSDWPFSCRCLEHDSPVIAVSVVAKSVKRFDSLWVECAGNLMQPLELNLVDYSAESITRIETNITTTQSLNELKSKLKRIKGVNTMQRH